MQWLLLAICLSLVIRSTEAQATAQPATTAAAAGPAGQMDRNCFDSPQNGMCFGMFVQRWFYDSTNSRCTLGQGCHYQGFMTPMECNKECRCKEPLNEGSGSGGINCELEVQKYAFIADTCQPFMYTGCGGNGNRFNTLQQCMSTCKAREIEPMEMMGEFPQMAMMQPRGMGWTGGGGVRNGMNLPMNGQMMPGNMNGGGMGNAGMGMNGMGSFGMQDMGMGGSGMHGMGNPGMGGARNPGMTNPGMNGMNTFGPPSIGNPGMASMGSFGQAGNGNPGMAGMGSFGQAGNGNPGMAGMGSFGQAGNGNPGMAGMGNFGQAGNGNPGMAGMGNFGQATNTNPGMAGMGSFGQATNGNPGMAGIGSSNMNGVNPSSSGNMAQSGTAGGMGNQGGNHMGTTREVGGAGNTKNTASGSMGMGQQQSNTNGMTPPQSFGGINTAQNNAAKSNNHNFGQGNSLFGGGTPAPFGNSNNNPSFLTTTQSYITPGFTDMAPWMGVR